MADKKNTKESDVSRREFFKVAGIGAAAAQVGAVAGAGFAAGNDPSTHTGWQHLHESNQFVDRKPFEFDGVPYEIVGKTRRPEEVESVFGRSGLLRKAMMEAAKKEEPGEEAEGEPKPKPKKMDSVPKMDEIEGPLGDFYGKRPDIYELDKTRVESIYPKKKKDREKYGSYYTLIDAWSGAWSTSEDIEDPPEVSDFEIKRHGRSRKIPDAVPFKTSKLASKLIKQVSYHFGATMVGITKLNPDWCYNHDLRGSSDSGSYEIPEHWKYVIAFGLPHQWEQVNSNPNMGSSFDAYARVTIAARRMENFIKSLGYPARRHSPNDGYDLIAVPILVEAGLGQQGRHGIVITPETGSNFRTAFVTTSLPMECDKPIDFGVKEFCEKCKICAEICPSRSISFQDNNEGMETRGYKHWEINQTSCFNYWMQSMGGMGCRVCLIACPYSRKNNWVHGLARTADSNDPTGLVAGGMTWMQQTFFDMPKAEDYLPPPDGEYANYREPPDWLRAEEYLDIETRRPKKGD